MTDIWHFCLSFWKYKFIKVMSNSVNGSRIVISDTEGMSLEAKPNHNDKE